MNERVGRVKRHFQENKKVYIATTCGVLVGAAGVVGAAFAMYAHQPNTGGTQIIQKIIQIGYGHKTNASIIQLVERSTPSKPVHLKGTNLYFSSLSEAARKTGHTISDLSKHVNGKIPDLKGDVFELLESAA